MAYNNQPYQPYGSSADAYSSAAHNPFASASEVDLHAPYSATYPPHNSNIHGSNNMSTPTGLYQAEDRAGSAWSLDDQDLAAGGYDKVQRSADNPFSEGYKGRKSGNSRKKWIWIGIVAVVVVGGIAGGIAAWKATSGGSSSSSSSSASGSGKMQFIECVESIFTLLLSGNDRLTIRPLQRHGQGSQVQPVGPLPVREGLAPEADLLRPRVHAQERPRGVRLRRDARQRDRGHPAHLAAHECVRLCA